MAVKVAKAKQLSFSLPNKIGLMFEVAEALAAAGVNIEAICVYEMEEEGYFMIVPDNAAKAKKVIMKMAGEIKSVDVFYVEVPNKPGHLQAVSKKIADAGVDIEYIYGSPGKGKTATLVFKTDDDRKAIKALSA